MKKIYCFNNGGQKSYMQALAIAEDGNIVASHLCSSEHFMAHDLGITSDWKHESYNEHFGEGNWELEWVGEPDEHEGINEAFKLNKKLEKEQESQS